VTARRRRRPAPRGRTLGEHFKRDGSPKRAYTQAEAQAEAERSAKRAYRCKFCRAWHVGGRA
jgi:hypothetical protein